MPTISQLLLRASLAWLAIGSLIGTLIIGTRPEGFLPGMLLGLRGAHGQIMLIGWMLQAAMGTALWIFPRIGSPQAQQDFRLATIGAYALQPWHAAGIPEQPASAWQDRSKRTHPAGSLA